MKRWPVKILVFLLLGAIVNVAVAWGIWRAAYSGGAQIDLPFSSRSPNTPFDNQLWSRHATSSWPSGPPSDHAADWGSGISSRYLGKSASWTGAVRMDETAGERRERLRGTGSFEVTFASCGLPLRSVSIELWRESSSVAVAGIGPLQHDGVVFGDSIYPINVQPVGFAINTVFYAGILWVLWWGGFAAPFALRRRLRIRRGLCPACAYDLRGSAGMSQTCPECGKKL